MANPEFALLHEQKTSLNWEQLLQTQQIIELVVVKEPNKLCIQVTKLILAI